MTVAFDASSNSGTTARTADFSWSHVPVHTPRGVLVTIVGSETVDPGVAVTYGGAAMSQLTGMTNDSPAIRTAGDGHIVYQFFLGASVPTGTQTVAVTRGGSTADWVGSAVTVTAATNTEVADAVAGSSSTANASAPITTLASAVVVGGIGHDGAAVSAIGPGTVLDTTIVESDFGAEVAGIYRASSLQSGTFSADVVCDAAGRLLYVAAVVELAGNASVTPTTVAAVTTVPTPTVSATGSASPTPTTVAADVTVPTPSVTVATGVEFDAASNSGTNARTTDASWTHTPVGTPSGVLVGIVGGEIADPGTAVTYGGVAVPPVSGQTVNSPSAQASGDGSTVYWFFLGSGIPGGAATVAVTRAGSTAPWFGVALSVLAGADTEVQDANTQKGSTANAHAVLATTTDSFVAAAIGHDGAALSAVSPGTILDTVALEVDFGVKVGGVYYASATHSGTVDADLVSDSGLHNFYAVAVSEVGGTGGDASVSPTTIAAAVAVAGVTNDQSVDITPTTVAAGVAVETPTGSGAGGDAAIVAGNIGAGVTIDTAYPSGSTPVADVVFLNGPTLTTTSVTASSVALLWNPVPNAATYAVMRNGVVIVSGLKGTTFTDTGLNPNTTYRYRVKAFPSPAPPSGGGGGNVIDVPPPSALGDTTGLNGWLQSNVPDGTAATPTVVRFPSGASYTTSVQLGMSNRSHIVYDGRGSSITSTSTATARNVWVFTLCDDITIQDMVLTGNTAGTVQDGHGVNIKGCNDVTVSNITVTLCRDDGIRLGITGSNRVHNTNITVIGCTLLECHRHCMSDTGSLGGVLITGNTFDKTGTTSGTIIDIEPLGGDDADGVIIENNVFGFFPKSGVRRSIGINNGSNEGFDRNITIRNNTSDGDEFSVGVNTNPLVERFSNIQILDNVSDPTQGVSQAPFWLRGVDGVVVKRNRVSLNPGVGMVVTNSCTGVDIGSGADANVDTT